MPDPVTSPAMPAAVVKPGWKTSEFWKGSAAILLSTLFASGVLTNNVVLAIAGIAASMLGSMGYAVSRTMVKSSAAKALGAAAVLLLGSMAGSGCGASQRETTIRAALITADVARDGFVSYDAAKQSAIVNAATSLDDGRAKLAAYRDARAKVADAFTTAYRAIAAAAAVNDAISLSGIKIAIDQMLAVIAAAKGGTP